jgi:signal transduction histidine kinase
VSGAPAAASAAGWIWPMLMALLLVGLVLIGIACLWLLRREQALRTELDALRAAATPAPTTLPPPDPSPALPEPAGATAQADLSNEHESFSYTVSHDLRAPIRVVEGFTKILKEDYGRVLDRIGNDHLDRVLGAAARMNSMIDALLALSQLSSQPLAQQRVNLSQLATYVAEDLRRQWPEREVSLHIEPDMQVQGDPTLLRVVVENLLGNAWKYTAKCSKAEIRFGRDPGDRQVFTVGDNGAGFDMRFADRLFGVFQRLHSATDYQGTGVGLASVRRVLRRHGGDIWAESEVDQGARFHFTVGKAARGG